ncbi:MAG: hypothetical protein JXA23_07570, partial [Bacteroidales bacterium]|nr:hypothetical protein [Bacteroidales bacterium]
MILASPGLKSQDLALEAARERLVVLTDRTMYISGESVRFAVSLVHPENSVPEVFSRIVYCELITGEGNKIAGGKYVLQNFSGKGCLTIPEETISGICFLKVYTHFMRNTSTSDYTYIPLKIINPFKDEVLPGNEAPLTPLWESIPPEPASGKESLILLSGKTNFSPREEIRLDISVNAENEV